MNDQIIRKFLFSFFSFVLFFVSAIQLSSAANYPLEIIQPQPGLNTANRYYKAYPGIMYEVPVGVFGGTYPFTYSLVTAPIGMTINPSTGIITWPNPPTSGSPHSVTVQVVDSESTAVTRSWTITVTTSGFIFVDAVNGRNSTYNGCSSNCGTGTIANPFRDLCDVYVGTGSNACNTYEAMSNATYNGYFVYFRAGTYEPKGYFENSGQQYQLEWRGPQKPYVWLAYPGETVIIDHNAGSAAGAYFDMIDGDTSNIFIHGIRFQDMLNHAFRIIGNAQRTVFYDNTFYNGGPGIDGHNSSFIMFSSTGGYTSPTYKLIKDNTFDTQTGHWAYIKSYSTNKTVYEGNTLINPLGTSEGFAIKGGDQYVSIRSNRIDGTFAGGSIAGNWADLENMDVSFNNVLNALNNYSTSLYGALVINYHDTASGPVYIYRNTFEGTVTAKWATSDDGPFYLYNNVIINQNAGTPSGSHVTHYDVADPSRIILGTGATTNLDGYPADEIIDANGNLTDEYAGYIGTHGHLLNDGVNSSPPSAISVPQSFNVIP
jgi:hypothetical protein